MPTAFAVEDGLITSLHWTDLPGVHRVVQARFRERAAANTANAANAASSKYSSTHKPNASGVYLCARWLVLLSRLLYTSKLRVGKSWQFRR